MSRLLHLKSGAHAVFKLLPLDINYDKRYTCMMGQHFHNTFVYLCFILSFCISTHVSNFFMVPFIPTFCLKVQYFNTQGRPDTTLDHPNLQRKYSFILKKPLIYHYCFLLAKAFQVLASPISSIFLTWLHINFVIKLLGIMHVHVLQHLVSPKSYYLLARTSISHRQCQDTSKSSLFNKLASGPPLIPIRCSSVQYNVMSIERYIHSWLFYLQHSSHTKLLMRFLTPHVHCPWSSRPQKLHSFSRLKVILQQHLSYGVIYPSFIAINAPNYVNSVDIIHLPLDEPTTVNAIYRYCYCPRTPPHIAFPFLPPQSFFRFHSSYMACTTSTSDATKHACSVTDENVSNPFQNVYGILQQNFKDLSIIFDDSEAFCTSACLLPPFLGHLHNSYSSRATQQACGVTNKKGSKPP